MDAQIQVVTHKRREVQIVPANRLVNPPMMGDPQKSSANRKSASLRTFLFVRFADLLQVADLRFVEPITNTNANFLSLQI
jgi:hypothetical protein